jgi:hypothetical protein
VPQTEYLSSLLPCFQSHSRNLSLNSLHLSAVLWTVLQNHLSYCFHRLLIEKLLKLSTISLVKVCIITTVPSISGMGVPYQAHETVLRVKITSYWFLRVKRFVYSLSARILLLILLWMKVFWSANFWSCCLFTVAERPVSRPTVHSYEAWSQFNSWCTGCRTHGITSAASSQVRIKVYFETLYPIFVRYHPVQVFVTFFPPATLKLFMKLDMSVNC